MKVAILIPDRGDRPKLLENCLRMMDAQTRKADHIELVNDPPSNNEKDITWRYRSGYDRLRGKGFDIIALIENDDWYSPKYLEYMLEQWETHNRPEMLGTNYTIYYHIKLMAWFKMSHPERASAMNTLIRPDLNFPWCVDADPYTDLHLWFNSGLKGKIIEPPLLSIGIKHEEGLHGGRNHIDRLDRYINNDKDGQYLKLAMDPESFRFYSSYYR